MTTETTKHIDAAPTEGVIVAANRYQEWLLPWWWMNYAVHNKYPVTFINLGDMSEQAITWCQEHGNVVKLDIDTAFVADKEAIDPRVAELWEKICSVVWRVRKEWWKKPFVFLKTPYQNTVWMDLDCQVRGSIKTLFPLSENEAGIAIAPEPDWSQELNLQRGFLIPGEILLNSGVVVFKKDSPIIKEFAEQSLTRNDMFYGDQQLLSRILFYKGLEYTLLPPKFNWLVQGEINRDAIIIHWYGGTKEAIKLFFDSLQENFLINLSFTKPFEL